MDTPTSIRYELIIYWSEDDQSFVVEVPELPGCMADGETYEAAVANARQVIDEWLDTARNLGRPIPEPKGQNVMSHHSLQHFVSPTHGHEKLVSASYGDLIDIFEDRTRNWLLMPAERLLQIEHGEIAAVALLTGYFEGIEIYFTGEDSRNRSGEFFARGLARVFKISDDPDLSKKISGAIYSQVRCGFAHDGMFRNRVLFSDTRPEPILVTWPRRNGVFDAAGEVGSILINPKRFYDSIRTHFDCYIQALRTNSDRILTKAFEAAVALKWGLNEEEPIIGMTEDEFRAT